MRDHHTEVGVADASTQRTTMPTGMLARPAHRTGQAIREHGWGRPGASRGNGRSQHNQRRQSAKTLPD